VVEPWRKQNESIVYDRFRRVLSRRFELPNGEVADFEILDLYDSAAVLALTPSKEVILVEEFRPGPEAILFELPGGIVEPGQAPAAAAQAELLEETGYVGDLAEIGTVVRDAYATSVKHVFAATSCRQASQPAQPQLAAPMLMRLDAFRDHLRQGRLTDSEAAYRALDALGLL
jgi:ADP-ribose pyrophosphatase